MLKKIIPNHFIDLQAATCFCEMKTISYNLGKPFTKFQQEDTQIFPKLLILSQQSFMLKLKAYEIRENLCRWKNS